MHPVRVHRYHSTDLKKLHCIILVTATEGAEGCGVYPLPETYEGEMAGAGV